MTISESFFFHKNCLNNLTMAHQSFLQHSPASSIRLQLMEDLWFIMEWKGEREGGSVVGWCWVGVIFNIYCFFSSAPLIALA